MSSQASDEASGDPGHDHLEEVRQAAGSVVASLKWLLEATERVVDDPDAFAHVAASGRSVIEAFVGGFTASPEPQADCPGPDGNDPSSL